MSYKLSKFEKIKNDYQKYKNLVEKIQNPRIKQQFSILLKDFIVQLDLIEQGHSSSGGGFLNPRNNKENIIRLIEIRKKLEALDHA